MNELLLLFGVGALILMGLSFTHFEIKSSIMIDAPAEDVWSTIIQFERYGEWNSQLAWISGKPELGSTVSFRLSPSGAKPYAFSARIIQLEQGRSFGWLAVTGLPGIFDGAHVFEVEALSPAQSLLVNRERYSGIASQLVRLMPLMRSAPDGFRQMNLELKAQAERE